MNGPSGSGCGSGVGQLCSQSTQLHAGDFFYKILIIIVSGFILSIL